ncbi:hypothetical protein [Cellulomonas sp. NS3]|uniref:hypothetical protein n=1 Tax=Cellulomonas sp. NS3 TaxID=2973977 RepID=UPI0021632857|nr:hypothetical protein [Cellulomonas sp. NS3]
MTAALLGLAAAALCSGTATILQAVAARRETVRPGLALWRGLARSATYWSALALVAAGFGLSFLALRTLPLFLVQAGRASSLVVAALLATVVLGARLRWVEIGALVAVGAGLVVLAAAVEPEPAAVASAAGRWTLVVILAVVLTGAAAALRLGTSRLAGLVLAALSGTGFAVLAAAARTLPADGVLALLTEPLAWCLGAGGVLGLALGALALQRAPVVAATAVVVGVETCLGAALGIVLAGDRPAVGAGATTALAFALVVLGALALARFGSPETAATPAALADGGPPAAEPGAEGRG